RRLPAAVARPGDGLADRPPPLSTVLLVAHGAPLPRGPAHDRRLPHDGAYAPTTRARARPDVDDRRTANGAPGQSGVCSGPSVFPTSTDDAATRPSSARASWGSDRSAASAAAPDGVVATPASPR